MLAGFKPATLGEIFDSSELRTVRDFVTDLLRDKISGSNGTKLPKGSQMRLAPALALTARALFSKLASV